MPTEFGLTRLEMINRLQVLFPSVFQQGDVFGSGAVGLTNLWTALIQCLQEYRDSQGTALKGSVAGGVNAHTDTKTAEVQGHITDIFNGGPGYKLGQGTTGSAGSA